MLTGDLGAADVPAAWDELTEGLLGLKVEKASDGCLQDIHWSMGAMGYFPTYTLGNLYAAQLYRQAVEDEPQIPAQLARGDYQLLLGWMRQNIHQRGSRLLPRELARDATGTPLSAAAHLDHLRQVYT